MKRDEPIENVKQDAFDRARFAKKLITLLVDSETKLANGATVGLVGAWGEGKSSLLNIFEQQAQDGSDKGPVIVRFNPWLIADHDALIAEFFKEFVLQLGQVTPNNKLEQQIVRYAPRIVKVATFAADIAAVANGSPPIISEIYKFFCGSSDKTRSLNELRDELNNELIEFKRPIIVIIDDLDRLDDAEIRIMVKLIRSILDLKNISFLLAYDEGRVSEALAGTRDDEGRAFGRRYLEKVVPLSIMLPMATKFELRSMLVANLEKIGIAEKFWQSEYGVLLDDTLFDGVVEGPRTVNRIVQHVEMLTEMIDDDLPKHLLVGYSALRTVSPEKASGIFRYLNRDSPKESRSNLNKNDQNYFYYVCGKEKARFANNFEEFDTPETKKGKSLIEFLLPSLGSTFAAKEEDSLDNLRWANLIRRLGLPPGDFAIRAAGELIKAPNHEAIDIVRAATKDGTFYSMLDALLNRLEDLSDLDLSGLIYAILEACRNAPFKSGFGSDLAVDLSSKFLVEVARKHPEYDQQIRDLLLNFAAKGDCAVVMDIIQKSIIQHGVFDELGDASRNLTVFDKAFGEELLNLNAAAIVANVTDVDKFCEIGNALIYYQLPLYYVNRDGNYSGYRAWLRPLISSKQGFRHFVEMINASGRHEKDNLFNPIGADWVINTWRQYGGASFINSAALDEL